MKIKIYIIINKQMSIKNNGWLKKILNFFELNTISKKLQNGVAMIKDIMTFKSI